MGAKVRADRRSQHSEPLVAVEVVPAEPVVGGPDLEADVHTAALWFEALSPELQRYLDHEAQHGRGAYMAIAGGSADAAPASTPKPAAT
jgi:hypothetical protein